MNENIDFNIDNLNFGTEFNEIVIEFYKKISLIPNINLDNFKKNMENLKIRYIDDYNETNLGAYYLPFSNIITVFSSEKIEKMYLFHELMHLASYNKDMANCHVGLSIYIDSINNIGKGLNEGYTEYLTEKYFGCMDNAYAYKFEKIIANGIEMIIGEDKMQKLFFEADICNFINILTRYSSREEVILFLKNVDELNKINDFDASLLDIYKLNILVKRINKFLIKLFFNKQNLDLINDKIDENEFEENFITFISMLIRKIKYGNANKDFYYDTLIRKNLIKEVCNLDNYNKKENIIEVINILYKKKKLLFK